jgi:hypothetical protein
MKLKLLKLLPFLFMAVQGFSQQTIISAIGGFNFAKWQFDEKIKSNHSKLGVLFGASVDIPVQDELSAETGLQIGMFGTHLKNDFEEATYKTTYLLIPILAKYHFDNGISVHAGPEMGFLMSANSVLDGDHYSFKDDMKKTDIFLVIGGAYTLENGLTLGLRLHHGLTNVEDYGSNTLHNRAVTVMASYPLNSLIQK